MEWVRVAAGQRTRGEERQGGGGVEGGEAGKMRSNEECFGGKEEISARVTGMREDKWHVLANAQGDLGGIKRKITMIYS